ncbi:winged helix-turn-helix transcriptional regulator [Parasedimentitalea maritima]|uniref:Transcriptional regulator n=1 Tax=Parasedimentitalea maritima TaxID=2578117 RepID=A0A6A4RMJ2_9RHOB|nr:helix-turn-helix domain-containing protein [Zongyanglinia marina]KAE9631146.1 transcriptional regulator [Zongyanglinia marina]
MRPISKEEYDLKCATRQLLELMSEKWVPGLIYTLSLGPQRPGALTRRLEGISKKMLTQTLRNLEDWGVVHRTVFEVVPPHVEYALTPLGEKMVEPIALIHGWAQENRENIAMVFTQRLASKQAAKR